MDCEDCSCNPKTAAAVEVESRTKYITQAKRLVLLTIAWNLFEGAAGLGLGCAAGSVALVGFGLDSAIETASAGVIGWRFWSKQKNRDDAEHRERVAAKVVGALLLCLAAYIGCDAIRKLGGFGEEAKESVIGIALATGALVV